MSKTQASTVMFVQRKTNGVLIKIMKENEEKLVETWQVTSPVEETAAVHPM